MIVLWRRLKVTGQDPVQKHQSPKDHKGFLTISNHHPGGPDGRHSYRGFDWWTVCLWRWVLKVWMELHSFFETAHARCFCRPVSFDVRGWDVTSRRKKLCGKFSMCWYVSCINGCFDIAGAETLILPSFMCHSLKWKKCRNYITRQCTKSMRDPQSHRLRPTFILHCVCWWNMRLYCLILKPTPQCIHQQAVV